MAAKTKTEKENMHLAAKIGEHEVSITGPRDFIDEMINWWQEQVNDYEIGKSEKGKNDQG